MEMLLGAENPVGNDSGEKIVSMHDPIADMLTRIRNGQQAKHKVVEFPHSKLKEEVARVLKEEGYIVDYYVKNLTDNIKSIGIELKYYYGKPVIERLIRISRPGCRVYSPSKDLKPVPGFGIHILSTSTGVVSNRTARANGVGGEIICEVA